MEYPAFSDVSDEELIEATQAAEYLNELGFGNIDIQRATVPEVCTLLVFPFLRVLLDHFTKISEYFHIMFVLLQAVPRGRFANPVTDSGD
jgi:hypothetical protein